MWPGEGFWVFDEDLAVIETTTAEIKITQPREIALFVQAFKRLQDHAVYGADARDVITATIRQLAQED